MGEGCGWKCNGVVIKSVERGKGIELGLKVRKGREMRQMQWTVVGRG